MGFFFRFFFYGTIISGITLLALSLLTFSDVCRVIHNHAPGPCNLIDGMEIGSEDVDILPNGIAIFSTGVTWSRKYQSARTEASGFATFNISTPNQPAKKLKINGFKGHPNFHGISLYGENGKVYLYAINHAPFNEHPPADTVEKFLLDIEKGVLSHEKTFTDPEFVGLNDLTVVGMDRFYASNAETFKSKILREIELFLFFIPAQNVVYYDGQKASVVLPGMFGANGLDVSPDRKFLYVSEISKKRVSSYRIQSPTDLIWHDSKYLGTIPDNINVNHRTGDLWIGAHPAALQLVMRLTAPSGTHTSPSQVLRVIVKDGKFTESYEMFADNGHQLVGSSAAAYHKGKNMFVIGTIDHKAMFCKCDTCPNLSLVLQITSQVREVTTNDIPQVLYKNAFFLSNMGFFFRLFVYGSALSSFTVFVLSYLNYLDMYRIVHNHTPGPCHIIPGINDGSEDVDILPNGMAIFSTGLRWSKTQPETAEPSGFVALNISTPEKPSQRLKINGYKGHLNFHGISLYVQDGKIYLYAVNHPPFNDHPPADTVEKFSWDVDKGILHHEKTFSDPEFVGLNDLVVVRMDQFYISNMQTFKNKFLREFEMTYLYFVPAQNVLYYDGKEATVVLSGVFGANGVDVSPDQKFLYLAEFTKKRIRSYRIENPTTLVPEDSKFLGTNPDNINVNHRTGDLWIGAHPSLHQLLKRLASSSTPRSTSSSQVIRVTTKDGKFLETSEIFADNGQQLSGSSSAAFHKGKNVFIVGTVDGGALFCKCLTCPQ
ncbi:uncharacterized protein LOC129590780 [Paramacrobiotus metropolitanus]|uniref:uncharacterized protein LOC129590780 n=1 Tax=Paramacrobiotus metropolitanus TaxID=2943436 RepID=UPI0024460A02|nr:uncharacterized protein LOC129590780 [Paramacrobiotus metropolitanus]